MSDNSTITVTVRRGPLANLKNESFHDGEVREITDINMMCIDKDNKRVFLSNMPIIYDGNELRLGNDERNTFYKTINIESMPILGFDALATMIALGCPIHWINTIHSEMGPSRVIRVYQLSNYSVVDVKTGYIQIVYTSVIPSETGETGSIDIATITINLDQQNKRFTIHSQNN